MIRLINICVIFVTWATVLQGQTISRSVVATTGDYTTSAGMTLSSTTGETMVETYSNSNLHLTQGFQQSSVQTQQSDDTTGLKTVKDGNLTLYPNPVIRELHIKIETSERTTYQIQVLDVLGRSVITPQTKDVQKGVQHYRIDMSSLPPGMYFVRLRDLNGQSTRTYKINKVRF